MDKKEFGRARGPYPRHRADGTISGWRVSYIDEHGREGKETFATEKEAIRERDKYNAEVKTVGVTVSDGIDRWHEWQTEKGLKASSIEAERRVVRFFVNEKRNGGQPIRWLLGAAEKLYESYRARDSFLQKGRKISATTVINNLAVAKRFGKFLVKRKLLPNNPFDALEPVGRKRHGGEKRGLTFSEVDKLRAVCLADENTVAGAAVLCCLFLGVRSTELCSRRIRDLDGDTLWITGDVKTASARRPLRIPTDALAILKRLVQRRSEDDYIFRPDLYGYSRMEQPTRSWLRTQCVRLAEAAGLAGRGLECVSPQTLRRTLGRLATEAGVAGLAVQAHLGHRLGTSVTETSYIGRGRNQAALTARAQAAISARTTIESGGTDSHDIVPAAETGPQETSEQPQVSRRETHGVCFSGA